MRLLCSPVCEARSARVSSLMLTGQLLEEEGGVEPQASFCMAEYSSLSLSLFHAVYELLATSSTF